MLSQTAEYALRATVYLARQNGSGYWGVREIAAASGVPRNYLSKILQQLARAEILASQKGFGGGFRLARGASGISLLDVMTPMERVERRNACPLGPKLCMPLACPLHQRWNTVVEQYMDLLRNTTLQDLRLRDDTTECADATDGQAAPPAARRRGRAKSAAPAPPVRARNKARSRA